MSLRLVMSIVWLSVPGYAGSVMFDLNTVYSGTAPASTQNPWLRATLIAAMALTLLPALPGHRDDLQQTFPGRVSGELSQL